jgi:hypothetical protein
MRTVLITLAAAASALAVATPAAAQYFPQRQIHRLDRRNVLSDREARRLRNESVTIERRLRVMRQNGLHPRERYDIERRIAWLEQRLWRDARDGNRWSNDHRQGYNQHGIFDRDRDGRDDRVEDDRGFDHD